MSRFIRVIGIICLLVVSQKGISQVYKELIFHPGHAPYVDDPSGKTLDLQKGKVYVFRLKGANSAYYDAQYGAQQLSKNITFPANLQGFIPDGSIPTKPSPL